MSKDNLQTTSFLNIILLICVHWKEKFSWLDWCFLVEAQMMVGRYSGVCLPFDFSFLSSGKWTKSLANQSSTTIVSSSEDPTWARSTNGHTQGGWGRYTTSSSPYFNHLCRFRSNGSLCGTCTSHVKKENDVWRFSIGVIRAITFDKRWGKFRSKKRRWLDSRLVVKVQTVETKIEYISTHFQSCQLSQIPEGTQPLIRRD